MSSSSKRLLPQALLVVTILMLGGTGTIALLNFRDVPEKNLRSDDGPMVEVQSIHRENVSMKVHGYGTVRAKVRAKVVPQVSGRIVAVHRNMVTGGLIRAGESMFEIDPEDYKLAEDYADAEVQHALAAVATANAQLATVEVEVRDALNDLERLKGLTKQEAADQRELDKAVIAYDQSQSRIAVAHSRIATAKAQVSIARIAWQQASLNLNRTRVTMPFNAVVVEENVAYGQYLLAGQPIAEVYCMDVLEIPVPLEDRELAWLNVAPFSPGWVDHDRLRVDPPLATVNVGGGDEMQTWDGHVARIEGHVDVKSQMTNVVVEVNVLAEKSIPNHNHLSPGTFVRVALEGKTLQDVFAIPRSAVHNHNEVWIAHGNRLEIKKIEIIRKTRNRVFVTAGLEDEDQLITSRLDKATNGMKIRLAAPSIRNRTIDDVPPALQQSQDKISTDPGDNRTESNQP